MATLLDSTHRVLCEDCHHWEFGCRLDWDTCNLCSVLCPACWEKKYPPGLPRVYGMARAQSDGRYDRREWAGALGWILALAATGVFALLPPVRAWIAGHPVLALLVAVTGAAWLFYVALVATAAPDPVTETAETEGVRP